MYSKHRKPLKRFSSFKRSLTDKDKKITEDISNNENPFSGEFVLVGQVPTDNMYVDEEQVEEKIAEMEDAISLMNNTITANLFDLGLTDGNHFSIINSKKIYDLVFLMGKRTVLKNRRELYHLLENIFLCDKMALEFDNNDSNDSEEDNQVEVAGMVLDNMNNKWVAMNESTIPVVMHKPGEGLICPACKTKYFSMNNVLLAQTVGVTYSNIKISEKMEHSVKYMLPHLILTPICSKCYCDYRFAETEDNPIKLNNVSHIINGCDLEKKMIPLIPICYQDYMNDKNINDNVTMMNGMLFWPKDNRFSVCEGMKKDLEDLEKYEEDNENKE